jgi:hypothetical protein
VVVQDRKNRNLLVVGNDVGVFFSVDGGAAWTQLTANLPTVAVHDLTIHPRENDLVIGTYGRALWTGDITPLQELSADVLAKDAHLFDIESKARYGFSTQGMNYHLFGDKYLEVPNEPEGLVINYFVKAGAANARLRITDPAGRPVRETQGPARAGLNRVVVPFVAGGGQRGRGAGGGAGAGPSSALTPGDYVVTLDVAGQALTKQARVRERIR